MKIAITGVSGFIGGQAALHFHREGHEVLGIDLRPCSENISSACYKFVQADFGSPDCLEILLDYLPDAILHFAASSLVAPSMLDPEQYYQNNVVQTKNLLDVWAKHLRTTRLIFASSSSIYGEPHQVPCSETQLPNPISPYAESKLMGEFMIKSYARAYNLPAVIFRYFNVCGADISSKHGQEPGATHIIARLLESIRDDKIFRLNGIDYSTPDGTCVRDHIHVQDVANLCEFACDANFKPGLYNVGLGRGKSNMQIINLAKDVANKDPEIEIGPSRDGDPSELFADVSRLKATGWFPKFNLNQMIIHAWKWYTR